LSINFDRWQGVGMAARSEQRLRGAGLVEAAWAGMAPSEGVEVFERLLSHALDIAQVVVSRRVLDGLPRDEVFPEPLGSGFAPGSEMLKSEGRSGLGERPPKARIVERIREIWAAVLGVASVDPEQSFFEQGGESLLALSILNRVREAFGTELSLREFFASPTVHGVAEQVARAWPEQSAPAEPALVTLPRSPRRLGESPAGVRRSGEGEDK
jgi:acyl carrier protein